MDSTNKFPNDRGKWQDFRIRDALISGPIWWQAAFLDFPSCCVPGKSDFLPMENQLGTPLFH